MTEPALDSAVSGNARLSDALVDFAAAMGKSVPDICSYGLTVGEAYTPFNLDPDEECAEHPDSEDDEIDHNDVACSQIWVRVSQVTAVSVGSQFGGAGCDTEMSYDLEVGVLRCFGIPEDGEAPTTSEMTSAVLESVRDMNAIQCAVLSNTNDEGSEIWDDIVLGTWNPIGPAGGQYGGIWTVTVRL